MNNSTASPLPYTFSFGAKCILEKTKDDVRRFYLENNDGERFAYVEQLEGIPRIYLLSNADISFVNGSLDMTIPYFAEMLEYACRKRRCHSLRQAKLVFTQTFNNKTLFNNMRQALELTKPKFH